MGYTSAPTTMAWFANIFVASSSASKVKAVSFYTPVPSSPYEVRIYKNVLASKPTSGIRIKTIVGTMLRPGYNTINFSALPAVVTAGKRFSVVVKLTTPNYNFPIPMEEPIQDYSSAANAYSGQSFVSHDGINWEDLTSVWHSGANVALKAFGGP